LFTDNEFLPNQQALGNLEMNIQDVQWIRLQSMIKTDNNSIYKNAVIFDNTIVAEDVCQGALGDCYLLAAFATLCERKVFIQNCFLTTTYNPYGKYRLRFYDLKTKQFVIVTIDDYIPCDKNKKPIFTKFNGHEMWPLLLEKGYAKFKGNYHNIEKGNPLIALKELTGYEGEQFIFGGLKTNHEELFMKLQRYSYYGVLMTSSSKGKDNTKQQQHDSNEEATVVKSSIVPGHAYSILDIKTPTLTTSRIHLLKLRNPWYVCTVCKYKDDRHGDDDNDKNDDQDHKDDDDNSDYDLKSCFLCTDEACTLYILCFIVYILSINPFIYFLPSI